MIPSANKIPQQQTWTANYANYLPREKIGERCVPLPYKEKKKIHLADLKAFNIAEEINNLLVSLHSQWISTFFEESCAHFFSGSCKVNLFLLRPWRRMAKVDLGGRTEKVEVILVLQRSGTFAFQNESHIPSFPELLKADQFNDKDHLLQMEDVVSEFR